jgi:hypothetical protein
MRLVSISAKQIALIALVCSLVSVCLNIIYFSMPSYSVVSFNEKEIAKSFVAQLSHQNKTDNEIEIITKRFSVALKKSLADFAASNHVIILKQSNTLATSLDRTQAIGVLVAKNMRHK